MLHKLYEHLSNQYLNFVRCTGRVSMAVFVLCLFPSLSLFLSLSVSLDGLFDLLEAIVPSENPVEAITSAGPAYPVPSDVLIKQSSDFSKPSFFRSKQHAEPFERGLLTSLSISFLYVIYIMFFYIFLTCFTSRRFSQ